MRTELDGHGNPAFILCYGGVRQYGQRNLTVLLAVALTTLAAGVAHTGENDAQTGIVYFADFTEHWGVPEGITRLSAEQVSHRQLSWRFTYSDGKVREVARVNSAGQLQDDVLMLGDHFEQRPTIMEIKYDAEGRVSEIAARDQQKRLTHIEAHAGGRIEFRSAVNAPRTARLDVLSPTRRSRVNKFLLQRDREGYLTGLWYADAENNQTKDRDGILGVELARDTQGRVIETHYVDGSVKPGAHEFYELTSPLRRVVNRYGVGGKKYEYDKSGTITRTTWINERGETALNRALYAVEEAGVDAWGNVVKRAFRDAGGQLCSARDGTLVTKTTYDESGSIGEETSCDQDGNPSANLNRFATVRYGHDERGNTIDLAYFNAKGLPVLRQHKVASYRRRMLAAAGATAVSGSHDVAYQPSDMADRISWRFDERSDTTELAVLNDVESSYVRQEGYAAVRFKYDERGNKSELAMFGRSGKPCPGGRGVHRITAAYTAPDSANPGKRDRVSEIAFWGVDGTPCVRDDGVAKIRFTYGDSEQLAKEAIAEESWRPRGNWDQVVRIEYLDKDGKPCMRKGGAARYDWRYTEAGDREQQTAYDAQGAPYRTEEGFAIIRWKYDALGNLSEKSFFDDKGKPCVTKIGGFAVLKRTWDARGNKVKEEFLDVDGKPCVSREGYASAQWKYNGRGDAVEETTFDMEGKPCMRRGEFASVATYASIKWKHDEHGNLVEQGTFDADGKPCSRFAAIRWTYDLRRSATMVELFGADGKPVSEESEGYAALKRTYDRDANLIEEVTLGTDGKPCLRNDGYAVVKRTYDDHGDKVEERYFDLNAAPCLIRGGYAWTQWAYDEEGKVIKQRFFDLTGAEVAPAEKT